MEFWHERPFRLHDRIEFRRPDEGAAWTKNAALSLRGTWERGRPARSCCNERKEAGGTPRAPRAAPLTDFAPRGGDRRACAKFIHSPLTIGV